MEPFQIGQYVLEEKLGEGGMAEVWKARNVVLGNYAAIKFLNPTLAGNPDIEQRFLGEGKRQANLQHPSIVSAFDFLYVDGRSYLVMRYVKGESLEDRLFRLRAPMPLQAVLSISSDVLSALEYAHSERVIHRDIKPSNILLENSGRALVLDFGIAVVLGEQRVTRAGVAVGTPHYMSPEQIVGAKQFDHRSDIYSYGCVLYQMLTERPPFDAVEGEGDTEYFVKNQHVNRAPLPPRQLNASIPDYIQAAVLRCLEKNPADRFDSCKDLMTALSTPPSGRAGTATVLESPALAPPPGGWRTQVDVPGTAQPDAPVRRPTVVSTNEPMQPHPSVSTTTVPANATSKGKSPLLWIAAGVAALALLGGGGYFWHANSSSNRAPEKKVAAAVKEAPEAPKEASKQVKPDEPTPAPVKQQAVTKPKVKPQEAVKQPTQLARNIPPPQTIPAPRPEPVKPPLATPPPPTRVEPASASSGILPYSGGPIPPGGQAEFNNLPPGRLKLSYDHAAWKPFFKNPAGGGPKTLVMQSLKPGYQNTCQVGWERVQ